MAGTCCWPPSPSTSSCRRCPAAWRRGRAAGPERLRRRRNLMWW
uniref:Putative selenoprotein S n=1 Tax=Taeniopygia guttata TaxID=59729 RepID=B5FZK1_TAEGU|nr:putative selenoprotein S [Taeniopygia guttata]